MNDDDTLDQPLDGSIVSYPVRCSLWGDGNYRGNCDGQLFKELIARYRPRTVADPMEGSGTTRDVVAWWNAQSEHKIDYWGGDLRTGFNLLETNLPRRFDFVWIHPPYWNIILFSQLPGDLSNLPSYHVFRDALRTCLRRCSSALNQGGRLAILIGDIRRQGKYTSMVRDVLNMESEIGQLRAIIIKAQHKCRSDSVRYGPMEDPRIQHEYCVIFKKHTVSTMLGNAAI